MKKRDKHETAPENGREPEPFIRRWTRRKADAGGSAGHREPEQREPAAPDPADADSAEYERDAPYAAEAAGTGADDIGEARGDADMPSLDSIDQGGSVADFFSSRVSPGLRRAALRRLFAQSALPVVDDLDDYADDYTKFTRLGDLVTNEMRHRLEVARQRLAQRAEERLATEESASAAASQPTVAGTTGSNDAEESVQGPGETDEQEHSEHDRNTD